MNRQEMYRRLHGHEGPWDMIVIGGGASGVGTALDAASRGYEVLLVEQSDFGKGTSSRSTKLVHGGVRYLEQGNISLVMEALKERGILLQNAPHLVQNLGFVVPNYDWWEAPFYGIGLKLYDMLAGKYGFGRSRILSKAETLERLPTIRTDGLRGGVIYFDGQFDDSRLLIDLATTAYEQGAVLLNYVQVTGLLKNADGFVDGVEIRDMETGDTLQQTAKVVVNATGPFTDNLRRLADPSVPPIIAPSQGIHLVFDGSFLGRDNAIMIPHTSDGRVMFAIPWHGHTVVGTTDTPIAEATLEPVAMEQEVDFLLHTASRYLETSPSRADVLSVFAGIRPLVRSSDAGNTAALSRDHTIRIEDTGMITLCGGKWTTYRRMAEDCVNHATELAQLPERPCVTTSLRIHGQDTSAIRQLIEANPELGTPLHAELPYTGAEVVWAARQEMACGVEDVLARRTRALFLRAQAAIEMAPGWRICWRANCIAIRNGRSAQIQSFNQTARHYLLG